MIEGFEEMEEVFEGVDIKILEEVEFLEGDRFTCVVQRILLTP